MEPVDEPSRARATAPVSRTIRGSLAREGAGTCPRGARRAHAGMTRDDATRCDAPGDGLERGGAVWPTN